MNPRRLPLIAAVLATLVLAGCASADKGGSGLSASAANGTGAMPGMNMGGTSAGGSAGSVVGSATSGMSAMKTTKIVLPNGVVKPVPITTIASGYWKDMAITAQTMTPVPFYIFTGTGYSEVKPTSKTSFHLMVMLNDRHTGEPISYATVWANIFKNGRRVFDERQWAMNSEFMGPHYGNDVTLPGPGRYTLQLLVTAPAAAEHVEYYGQWQGTHTMTSTFTWKG